MQFEDVKTTIQEHPAETIAAVAVVSLVGTLFYCNWKNRKHQRELAQLEMMHAREMLELSRPTRSKYRIQLAS